MKSDSTWPLLAFRYHFHSNAKINRILSRFVNELLQKRTGQTRLAQPRGALGMVASKNKTPHFFLPLNVFQMSFDRIENSFRNKNSFAFVIIDFFYFLEIFIWMIRKFS